MLPMISPSEKRRPVSRAPGKVSLMASKKSRSASDNLARIRIRSIFRSESFTHFSGPLACSEAGYSARLCLPVAPNGHSDHWTARRSSPRFFGPEISVSLRMPHRSGVLEGWKAQDLVVRSRRLVPRRPNRPDSRPLIRVGVGASFVLTLKQNGAIVKHIHATAPTGCQLNTSAAIQAEA